MVPGLLLDQGRLEGKVMAEVPNLPGVETFGSDVFNWYGNLRDQYNARIDELTQEAASQ